MSRSSCLSLDRDVTTIMGLLADIKDDIHRIRELLEDEDGEEEVPETD